MYVINVDNLVELLTVSTKSFERPAAEKIIEIYGKDPYLVLISCILSLRTTDKVSFDASCRLFAKATDPEAMSCLSEQEIATIIFPVGFYKKKSYTIKTISSICLKLRFEKIVPTVKQLRALPGVGLKTAHLVLSYAYDVPALCVDTHVHRISNRLGLVQTKTAEQTEAQLRNVIPEKYWIQLNSLLVMWGQNVCRPQSPKCSTCPLFAMCARVGVTNHR